MKNVYSITDEFEKKLCEYTGATYCVTLDNASNALFLALTYDNVRGKQITIPNRTYPSVPCEIIHAGGQVAFYDTGKTKLKGAYKLEGSRVVDSALRFTNDMYKENQGMFVCLSFTGAYKHLKLSKGGAILTDNHDAYCWFKRARFSGRRECPYNDDHFDMIGWNFYMMPELATRGLLFMAQFYTSDGTPIGNEDKEIMYPDLSRFEVYTKANR